MLDGEFEVAGSERSFVATTGSFVFIPKDTLHRFRNVGVAHGRLLAFFVPAGFEGFFAAVGQQARPGEPAAPLGPEEIERTIELGPRFGLEVRFPVGAEA